MSLSKIPFRAMLCLLAAGCASTPLKPASESTGDAASGATQETTKDMQSKVLVEEILATNTKLQDQPSVEEDESTEASDESATTAAKELGRIEEEKGNGKGGRKFAEIPVEVNQQVRKWIHYFTVKDRERFTRFLYRGEKYREVVENILEENNVPAELYYLALIESGFHTHALSHASAVGVWQFMRATGKTYGLESNYYVDERKDPIRATEAAAKHLRDLYENYQSWYLAMAAYNAGPGRVNGAIRRGRTRDYWTLAQRGFIPAETADYVPKFLAAVIIGRNPDMFGFGDIKAESYPDLEAVEVPSPVRLSDVSRLAKIPRGELERVNPHLVRGVTSPQSKKYEIWVPQEKKAAVDRIVTRLASYRLSGLRARREPSIDRARIAHTVQVKRGETLSQLSRRTHLSVAYLKRINGLKSSQIYAGQTLRIVKKSYHRAALTKYRVKSGDSLAAIAKKFGVTVGVIRKANRLHRDRIYTGQTLRIVSNI